MSWLIDGSNFLGRFGDRMSVDQKRDLLRSLASFARARRSRVTCYFDGTAPGGFATSLGPVQAQFSGSREADELIVDRVRSRSGETLHVVTSDSGLRGRISGRRVEVISCEDFRGMLEERKDESGIADGEDWIAYFSDPQNRTGF